MLRGTGTGNPLLQWKIIQLEKAYKLLGVKTFFCLCQATFRCDAPEFSKALMIFPCISCFCGEYYLSQETLPFFSRDAFLFPLCKPAQEAASHKLTFKSTYDLHMYPQQHCKISKLIFCVVELLQLVWIETPTNPTLKVIDIQACADVVHKHKDVLLVVDNTFMSAYFQVSTLFVYNYPVISVYLKIRF